MLGRDMGMLAVMTTPRCDLEAPKGAAELQNRTLWARVYVFFFDLGAILHTFGTIFFPKTL